MTELRARVIYEKRRQGMDIDRYQWSNLFQRSPIEWPGGAKLALWICVSLEWFRFDEEGFSIRPLASPMVEYPDFWGFTRLDYGNRAGVYRVLQTLEDHGARVTAALNSEICSRYPFVVDTIEELDWEVIGHGTSSTQVLHEGMPEAEERELISEALGALRSATSRPIRGWLSPSLSQSRRTPDLLAEQGIEYLCDWVNDDLPYPFQVGGRTIHSLPYSYEINDLHTIGQFGQTAAEFRDQIVDQADTLLAEAERGGGRCMCIALHPWLIGAPHRIRYLDEALEHLLKDTRI
ncbi:MAG: polysaccharide deacetylase family protein, partial [bacterium]